MGETNVFQLLIGWWRIGVLSPPAGPGWVWGPSGSLLDLFWAVDLFAIRHKPKCMTVAFSLMTLSTESGLTPLRNVSMILSGGVLQCRPCALSFKALSVQGSHKQKWVLKTQNHISQENDSRTWAQRGIRAEVTFWNDILVLVPACSWAMGPPLGFWHILKRRTWSKTFFPTYLQALMYNPWHHTWRLIFYCCC